MFPKTSLNHKSTIQYERHPCSFFISCSLYFPIYSTTIFMTIVWQQFNQTLIVRMHLSKEIHVHSKMVVIFSLILFDITQIIRVFFICVVFLKFIYHFQVKVLLWNISLYMCDIITFNNHMLNVSKQLIC